MIWGRGGFRSLESPNGEPDSESGRRSEGKERGCLLIERLSVGLEISSGCSPDRDDPLRRGDAVLPAKDPRIRITRMRCGRASHGTMMGDLEQDDRDRDELLLREFSYSKMENDSG